MALTFNPPIHPAEILRDEFLAPTQLSARELARRIGVPRTRIERLVAEKTALTPDTALRLARVSAPVPTSGSICRRAMTS